jgi:circadian clock protein KaiB
VTGNDEEVKDSFEDFEKSLESLEESDKRQYVLRLFVTGSTPRSLRAIKNIKQICEKYLQGRCDLEVIDLYQNPDLAKDEQILAVPTLIKKVPAPIRKVIGDLSNTNNLLTGLNLKPKE